LGQSTAEEKIYGYAEVNFLPSTGYRVLRRSSGGSEYQVPVFNKLEKLEEM